MKIVSTVSSFPQNPTEGGYYYSTDLSVLGVYKDGEWIYYNPLLKSNTKVDDLSFELKGYYPLYLTEAEAINASDSSSAHSHEIDGVVYYMPNGGIENKDFYHGSFGDFQKQNEAFLSNSSLGFLGQGPLPDWINPPADGSLNTMALVTLVNPNTGEKYTVPSGGYTLNVDDSDGGSDSDISDPGSGTGVRVYGANQPGGQLEIINTDGTSLTLNSTYSTKLSNSSISKAIITPPQNYVTAHIILNGTGSGASVSLAPSFEEGWFPYEIDFSPYSHDPTDGTIEVNLSYAGPIDPDDPRIPDAPVIAPDEPVVAPEPSSPDSGADQADDVEPPPPEEAPQYTDY